MKNSIIDALLETAASFDVPMFTADAVADHAADNDSHACMLCGSEEGVSELAFFSDGNGNVVGYVSCHACGGVYGITDQC